MSLKQARRHEVALPHEDPPCGRHHKALVVVMAVLGCVLVVRLFQGTGMGQAVVKAPCPPCSERLSLIIVRLLDYFDDGSKCLRRCPWDALL